MAVLLINVYLSHVGVIKIKATTPHPGSPEPNILNSQMGLLPSPVKSPLLFRPKSLSFANRELHRGSPSRGLCRHSERILENAQLKRLLRVPSRKTPSQDRNGVDECTKTGELRIGTISTERSILMKSIACQKDRLSTIESFESLDKAVQHFMNYLMLCL